MTKRRPSHAQRLRALYARIPEVECRRLCEHSCHARILVTKAEERQMRAAGARPMPNTDSWPADPVCPQLTGNSCRVYAARPVICRLWGAARSMPCPHGCAPENGQLNDAETLDIVITSLEISGNEPELTRTLRAISNDTEARVLLAGLVRGDWSQAGQLVNQILSHRSRQYSPARPRLSP